MTHIEIECPVCFSPHDNDTRRSCHFCQGTGLVTKYRSLETLIINDIYWVVVRPSRDTTAEGLYGTH